MAMEKMIFLALLSMLGAQIKFCNIKKEIV